MIPGITKKEELRKKGEKISVLIYGSPFIGKTTLAATFPKPLFLNTDGNVRGEDLIDLRKPIADASVYTGGVVKGEISEIWNVIKTYLTYIKKNIEEIKKEYETIVIDNIDDVYEFCRTFVLKVLGIEHEQDLGHGKAFSSIRKEFYTIISEFISSLKRDINIVLVSYDAIGKLEMSNGLVEELWTPSIIKASTSTGKPNETNINKELDLSARIVMKRKTVMFKEQKKQKDFRVLVSVTTQKEHCGNRIGIINEIIEPTYEKIMNEATSFKGEKNEIK